MTGNSSENPVLHVGIVAQLVEQRTENPCVDGSIPPDTTKSRSPLVENEGASFILGTFNVVLVVCEGGFGENLSHRGGVFD